MLIGVTVDCRQWQFALMSIQRQKNKSLKRNTKTQQTLVYWLTNLFQVFSIIYYLNIIPGISIARTELLELGSTFSVRKKWIIIDQINFSEKCNRQIDHDLKFV